jgi:Secretion system C-terminal sorting domain
MRKLLLTLAIFLFCLTANAQSITPFILNATGGTASVEGKKVYLDWSVAEMTLVNTMVSSDVKKFIIISNGFIQPPKDDGEGDEDGDDEYYYKYVKPENTLPELKIYPNPATNYLTVDIPMQEVGKIKLTLYNGMGELVYQKEITGYGKLTRETISMAPFMQGTYMLRVTIGTPGARAKNLTYKIFKAN